MTTSDSPLQHWTQDWQGIDEAVASPESICQRIHRRHRLIRVVAVSEVVVGIGMLAFLIARVAVDPDPIEKLAMGLLALITVTAFGFGWRSWYSSLGRSGESTAALVSIAVERTRAFEQRVRAGWLILAAQLAVFVPWIWHRQYGGVVPPSPRAQLFAWGFLAFVTTLAVAFILWVRSWVRRDATLLDELRRELVDEG